MEELVELLGLTAQHGRLLVDHALVEQIHGDLNHGGTRTLTVTCLEEPELALLHGELHVLHVVVVVLELVLQLVELLIDLGHGLLHRRILGHALSLVDAGALSPTLRTDLGDLLRGANTGHHVLALCVDEILAIEEVLAVTGVAAEANTRGRRVAHVTKHHGHDRNGRTPLVGDALHLTIENGALVHPAAEHGADSAPKLLLGIGGEVATSLLLDGLLEALNEFLKRLHREVLVEHNALLLLHLLDDSLERIDVLLVLGLHAEHNVAVHLNETAIAVINEVGVAGLCHHALGHLVVQAKVKDGVHHTWHRGTGTRTNRNQQRVLRIAKLAVHQLLRVSHGFRHLIRKQLNNLCLAYFIILIASVCGNRKARRHWHSDKIHFCQVGTLATQQVSHVCTTFGLTVTEEIDSFFTHS